MEENFNGNQPVPGPGPDAPRKEDTISKQRDLTLEEMKELNLSASSHAIPPEEAVRGENVLSPEAEMIKMGKDAIQEAVDFITGGVQEFDGYVTDCAEEVADYDMPFFPDFHRDIWEGEVHFPLQRHWEA